MSKIYIPADSPADWQRLLAEPEKHWKSGYSAKALAHCWDAADDFPGSVRAEDLDVEQHLRLCAAFGDE